MLRLSVSVAACVLLVIQVYWVFYLVRLLSTAGQCNGEGCYYRNAGYVLWVAGEIFLLVCAIPTVVFLRRAFRPLR